MAKNNHDIALEIMREFEDLLPVRSLHHSKTIFDADRIEMYSFVDLMNLLLFLHSNDDYSEFSDKIFEYKGKRMDEIPNCESIYEEFLRLHKK